MFDNMRKLFSSKPRAVVELKVIDWNKVTSVEDLCRIIKSTGFTVSVSKEKWSEFNHLLKDPESF